MLKKVMNKEKRKRKEKKEERKGGTNLSFNWED